MKILLLSNKTSIYLFDSTVENWQTGVWRRRKTGRPAYGTEAKNSYFWKSHLDVIKVCDKSLSNAKSNIWYKALIYPNLAPQTRMWMILRARRSLLAWSGWLGLFFYFVCVLGASSLSDVNPNVYFIFLRPRPPSGAPPFFRWVIFYFFCIIFFYIFSYHPFSLFIFFSFYFPFLSIFCCCYSLTIWHHLLHWILPRLFSELSFPAATATRASSWSGPPPPALDAGCGGRDGKTAATTAFPRYLLDYKNLMSLLVI